MKYPTDFRKTVETGVDPRLPLLKSHGINLDWKLLLYHFLRSKLTSHDNDVIIVLLLHEVSQNLERNFKIFWNLYVKWSLNIS